MSKKQRIVALVELSEEEKKPARLPVYSCIKSGPRLLRIEGSREGAAAYLSFMVERIKDRSF